MSNAVKVAVTGAAGQISYAMLFRIAAGQLLGPEQPVALQLLEIPPALPALDGVRMELDDCAFPLLQDVVCTDDPNVAFRDADYAFLVGAKPRGAGMERKDLLAENGGIFAPQGQALNENASRDVRVLVVGNPANTNALIAASNAPDLKPSQFSAMTRLDHNRGMGLLDNKTHSLVAYITKMTIWGNHSVTQYPDISNCQIDGTPAYELVTRDWVIDHMIPRIQRRGVEIIEARGLSSAASAADAVVDHMRDWAQGTRQDDWVSMSVMSDGSYGISEGVVFSFPVTCKNGEYEIVQGLDLNEFDIARIKASEKELLEERSIIEELLPKR